MKGDELKAANTISPVAALQGKVAGVEISGSDGGLFGGTKIQIRGASTLSSNNQPIYVVAVSYTHLDVYKRQVND